MPPPRAAGGEEVYVLRHGWHTDLAIPVAALRGDMAVFETIFPGLRVLVLGFGRRSFMMSPVMRFSDLLIGPFPGDGTLEVTGLNAPPDAAYDTGSETLVRLPPGGAARLSDFLWHTLKLEEGRPARLGDGYYPGSLFFATRTGYAGWYTCNTWTVAALQAAGVDVHAEGVVLSGQVMARLAPLAGRACALTGAVSSPG